MSKARTLASGNRKALGELFTREDLKAPSAIFPAVCLTDFVGTKSILEANWPVMVPEIRSIKTDLGGTSTFTGTSGTGEFTLDNADVASAILEFAKSNSQQKGGDAATADFTDLLSITIGGIEYEITGVAGSVLSLSGTPTGTSAEIYPHRIAGSSNSARLHSYVGHSFIGAGTTEILSMIMRRDHGQQITGAVELNAGSINNDNGLFSATGTGIGGGNGSIQTTTYTPGRLIFDSAKPTGSRVDATTTHSPDVGVHVYRYGEIYIPS